MRTLGAEVALCVALTACTAIPDDEADSASQAWTPTHCILNAHTDNGTVHFQGPNWLLTSSEGLGPQSLNVVIQQTVQPAISASETFKLDPSSISEAVGYSVTERYDVFGGATLAVPRMAFQRLEAYTAYQRTVWEIRDASCDVVLGLGASFRPIGVFFRTVNTSDVWIPDVDVYVVGPAPVYSGIGVPPPPPDAGAGDAGDAGAGDAGAEEATSASADGG